VTFMTVLLNVVYDGYQTFIREVKWSIYSSVLLPQNKV
jgi:hypothetical protein